MNKIYFFILFFFLLLFTGCEEVDVVNPQTTSKEYIVVRAELKAWSNFGGVAFTKTLPINEPYDTNKAFLKNVTAYLKIDGIRIIPLHFYQAGIYKPYGDVLIVPQSTYELFAIVDSTSIYGITKIPKQPDVTYSSYLNKHIEADVKSNPSEVYGAVWAIVNPSNNSVIDMGSDFLSVVNSLYDIYLPTTSVRTADIPDQYVSDTFKNYRCIKVYSFDTPYLKYFYTKNNNQPIMNAFIQGGDGIAWNVQGNNVIGLFIGSAEGGYVRTN